MEHALSRPWFWTPRELLRALSGFGKLVKAGTLSWATGKAETIFKKPAEAPWLALCTVEPKYTNTGTTITEPGTGPTEAQGYARKQVTFSEAVEGETATIENTAEEIMAAITGSGSATIIGWALVSASAAGNLIAFGTATSTVISKTQSPPTVAAKGLKIELK
jgi:hypothetical protein